MTSFQLALKRIKNAKFTTDQLVTIFEQLAEVIEQSGTQNAAMTLGYLDDNESQPGGLVPTINLMLSRVEDENQVDTR